MCEREHKRLMCNDLFEIKECVPLEFREESVKQSGLQDM